MRLFAPKIDPSVFMPKIDPRLFMRLASTLAEIDGGELAADIPESVFDAGFETWWLSLSLARRAQIIGTFIWVLAFLQLLVLSIEHQEVSAFLKMHTDLGPLAVASAAGWTANRIYRYFSE